MVIIVEVSWKVHENWEKIELKEGQYYIGRPTQEDIDLMQKQNISPNPYSIYIINPVSNYIVNTGLSDPRVSRRHLKLIISDDILYVIDHGPVGHGSTNGVYINNKRIRPAEPFPLARPSIVRLGREGPPIKINPKITDEKTIVMYSAQQEYMYEESHKALSLVGVNPTLLYLEGRLYEIRSYVLEDKIDNALIIIRSLVNGEILDIIGKSDPRLVEEIRNLSYLIESNFGRRGIIQRIDMAIQLIRQRILL